jgi:hypothetical protein
MCYYIRNNSNKNINIDDVIIYNKTSQQQQQQLF